jgi:tRNA pseudouridine55 synthase
MDGLLIVDKPKGITSQSVCLKLKRILGAKKCGHNGTLDPNATGVMVVAVDSATKLLKLIHEHDKEYIATIVFGLDSNTLDMDSDITKDISMNPSIKNIQLALEELKSRKTQIPPLTSAVKIDGMKLYEYQRKGIDVKVPSRNEELKEYEILSDLRFINNHYEIDIKISVSKGYFVRSLARDLGVLLGGCAILKDLRRTKSGEYKIEDAIPLDNITKDNIIPIFSFFDLPKVCVKDYMIPLVKNGITMDERQTSIHGTFYVDSSMGILAIYEEVDNLKYKPILIFKEGK